jgi:hypothetical protein
VSSITLTIECQGRPPVPLDSAEARRVLERTYRLPCVGTFVGGEWCIMQDCRRMVVMTADPTTATAMQRSLEQPTLEPGC